MLRSLAVLIILFLPSVYAQDSLNYSKRLKNELEKKETEESESGFESEDYSENLRTQIEEDEDRPNGEYIEQLRKEDETLEYKGTQRSDGYIQQLKREVNDRDALIDEDDKLPESAIQALNEGRSELRLKRPGETKGAFGLKIGAILTPNISGDADAVSSRAFSDVYGDGTNPNVNFFYEYHFIRNRVAGNFGLYFGSGLSVWTGKGQFGVTLTNQESGAAFSTESKTNFTFIAVPIQIGPVYRWRALHFLQLYAIGGAVGTGFVEMRNDSKDSQFGYSGGYFFTAGFGLLLDWISDESAYKLFTHSGIRHTYLTFEFTQMGGLLGAVDFGSTGFYAGFTFEF